MKTLEEYKSEQPIISALWDMTFTQESLVNRIPSTAIMQLLHEANKLDFTDGFSIKAIAEMDNAICEDAKQYQVLVSIGWCGENEVAVVNPQTHYIYSYETKEGKVFNTDFVLYEGEYSNKGYLAFLSEFSEQKVYLK
mgnify:CR=1 FL=1